MRRGLSQFIKQAQDVVQPVRNPAEHMPDDLNAAIILHQSREQSTSVGGLRVTPDIEEEVEVSSPKKVARMERATVQEANILGDLLDHVTQVRLDLQKLQSQREPTELIIVPNYSVGGTTGEQGASQQDPIQILPFNPYRYEFTITNIGQNTAYWNRSRPEIRQRGGITLLSGASYTVKTKASIWMYSPNGTSLDIYEKVYETDDVVRRIGGMKD